LLQGKTASESLGYSTRTSQGDIPKLGRFALVCRVREGPECCLLPQRGVHDVRRPHINAAFRGEWIQDYARVRRLEPNPDKPEPNRKNSPQRRGGRRATELSLLCALGVLCVSAVN
jgi:hypothetical protein